MARTTGSDGYVTLVVLVITGLLAALVTSLLTVSRPALDLARIGADDTAVDALIDGGVHAAGFLLFAAQQSPREVNGTSLRFSTGDVKLAVLDESGRVDLNTSAPELLEGLFSAVGGSSIPAAAFAARVVDWRDTDSDVAVGGAEANDYASAGATHVPRNGPFGSVDELRMILGLSQRDLSRLEPHLTVFNTSGKIDPFSAGRAVLMAVPGMKSADAGKILKAQAGGEEERDGVSGVVETYSAFFSTEPSGVYRVTVEAALGRGARDAAEAVIAAPVNPNVDFGVVSWSRPAPASVAR
jgi:general secretion pathway protein K